MARGAPVAAVMMRPIIPAESDPVYRSAQQRLARLLAEAGSSVLQGGLRGLEKESLRVDAAARIAQTPHPVALGSALTHPCITTDYSEALLEFITPPLADTEACVGFLDEIHRFVHGRLDGEMVWASSMPCVVEGEASIPIGRYGDSNLGLMKHVYRRGLGYRYGKLMQVIAGVHFNFSLPERAWRALHALEGGQRPLHDFVSEGYFGLIRNLQRLGWLVPYLTGASPAVCKSFLDGKPADLTELDRHTAFGAHATSLRMSGIGYQNRKSKGCGTDMRYDSLDAYVASLKRAIGTPCPSFEAIGVQVDGEWRQLNANILQIENEYYTTIRPKQPPRGLEKPSEALANRGVAYVELRSLDLDPFAPCGVDARALRFAEALLVLCALADSPVIGAEEKPAIDANLERAALRGREPGLTLVRAGEPIGLAAWAFEVLEAMAPVVAALDAGLAERPYAQALATMHARVADPQRTPSARVLAAMREAGQDFVEFTLALSQRHAARYRATPLAPERENWFVELAGRSLAEQAAIEASDELPFGEFLRRYFAGEA